MTAQTETGPDPARTTFGLDTFGDVTVDTQGRPVPAAQVIRDIL